MQFQRVRSGRGGLILIHAKCIHCERRMGAAFGVSTILMSRESACDMRCTLALGRHVSGKLSSPIVSLHNARQLGTTSGFVSRIQHILERSSCDRGITIAAKRSISGSAETSPLQSLPPRITSSSDACVALLVDGM